MARSIQKYLYDIQQSISSIEEYYDKVDNVIIWGVVNKNLPKLKEQVEDLLGSFTIL